MQASFLMDVTNDTDTANVLLKKADELEEKASHQTRDNLKDTKSNDADRDALITISGSKHNLGEVLSVNTGAVRLFGYTRAQFLGGNVNRIIPPPYGQRHDAIILKYLETGIKNKINAKQTLFAIHSSGFLIQVDMLIREVC